jgi:twinkle protein
MSSGQLFGQDKFPAGSAKAITITEGELDALSAFQMLGSKWPVVSVRSSSSAKKDCSDQFDYLNSFETIYLCFDNDEAGQNAIKAVAGLFDFNKVRHVRLTVRKDANEFLEAGEEEKFVRIWWNSKRFLPDEIISSYSEIDDIIENDKIEIGVSYPWPRLQEMTYGMRGGEFILLAAQEGVGKTEFLRALEYHVLKETPAEVNIGIIHLEETKGRAIKGLIGYELKSPVHLPDSMVNKEDMKAAYRVLTKGDNRVHYYSHFGSDDISVILGMVQFLLGPCGCKFLFLDHISMVVSGIDTDDERKSLDFISTRLKMLAESYNATVVCVSHVNDEGKTRGSRNISKVADLHIYLSRDLEALDENERNRTTVTVRKNRFGAKTGPAGRLVFDIGTFLLTPEEDVFDAGPPAEAT